MCDNEGTADAQRTRRTVLLPNPQLHCPPGQRSWGGGWRPAGRPAQRAPAWMPAQHAGPRRGAGGTSGRGCSGAGWGAGWGECEGVGARCGGLKLGLRGTVKVTAKQAAGRPNPPMKAHSKPVWYGFSNYNPPIQHAPVCHGPADQHALQLLLLGRNVAQPLADEVAAAGRGSGSGGWVQVEAGSVGWGKVSLAAWPPSKHTHTATTHTALTPKPIGAPAVHSQAPHFACLIPPAVGGVGAAMAGGWWCTWSRLGSGWGEGQQSEKLVLPGRGWVGCGFG